MVAILWFVLHLPVADGASIKALWALLTNAGPVLHPPFFLDLVLPLIPWVTAAGVVINLVPLPPNDGWLVWLAWMRDARLLRLLAPQDK